MLVRVRAEQPEQPAGDLHTCRMPRNWVLFNLARRICHMPTRNARLAFLAQQRLVETPEFMLDLDDLVRRVWPLRNEPIKQCWEALGLSLNEPSVAE